MTLKDALSAEDMLKEMGRLGGYADGWYTARCLECKRIFLGDKRASQCLPCAVKELLGAIGEWQPIEEAERDGKPVLCLGSYREGSRVYQAEWHQMITWHPLPNGGMIGKEEGKGGWFCAEGGGWTPMNPTHSRPLPAPPKAIP